MRVQLAIAATILRSQVQHSDFSSSINDFCDHEGKFLIKIFERPPSTPERCSTQGRGRLPEA
jgi:hypothetical protein